MHNAHGVAAVLFADRFFLVNRETAIDLASGAEVRLRFVTLDAAGALHDWLRRCAALLSLHEEALVPLVDFGLAGRDRHFEALGCAGRCRPWTSHDASAVRTLLRLAGGLHARGLSLGVTDPLELVDLSGRIAVVPSASLGRPLLDLTDEAAKAGVHEENAAREIESLRRRLSGWGTVRPPGARHGATPLPAPAAMLELLRQVAEVLDGGVSGRPRTVELASPEGTHPTVVLNAVARESRLRGYVPVHAARLVTLAPAAARDPALKALLHGRHVLVLHDGHPPCRAAAARMLLAFGLDSDRPHVLLGIPDGVPRCAHDHDPHGAIAAMALDRRAREQPAAYGPGASAPDIPVGLRSPSRDAGAYRFTPADADLARPRLRIAHALDAAARGRHATAARALREAFSMLQRRGDAAGAAESALALGRVLMARGQVGESARAFEDARRLFDEGRVASRSIVAAVYIGLAWTDAGRWLEAEAATRAAAIAATAAGEHQAGRFASLALARCLLWQGRVHEATDALPPDDTAAGVETRPSVVAEAPARGAWVDVSFPSGLDLAVSRECLAARAAAAAGDVTTAGKAAARARERATLVGRPLERAAACTAMATVYALLADAAAVKVQVEEGLRAARLAHAPLRAIRLRAALASGLLHAGKPGEARPLVARLARLDLAALPAVVRRPVEQVLGWKPPASAVSARVDRPREVADTVIELLGLCQSVNDEEGLARKAVAMLRARLGASVAGCFGLVEAQVLAPIATDGRDPPPLEVAQRAAETGLAIGPSSTSTRLEAAVPVRFGGQTIGALACRWAADHSPEWPASGAVLGAAAAALAPCLRAVLDRRAAPVPTEGAPEQMVGVSQAVASLRDEIQRAARAPFNVVIEGESGTGKELVARAIHRLGPRRHHRLCAINCAALTDELLDAELFGHARGAFTGAVAERKGLFEEADGGTLVLDEVSELSPRAQAKLLRAIQEGEVRRVGENLPRLVDTRIVAASNRPLRAAVEVGTFRRDLLYRLQVIRIAVPALRERADDIPLLATHFWQQATSRLGSRATLAPATLAALARYDWPGNVRELQNVMAALAVSVGRRGSVGPEQLPSIIAGEAAAVRDATLDEARRLFEARFVRAALARAGGQRAQAARDLGVTRQGLAKLLTRLKIAPG